MPKQGFTLADPEGTTAPDSYTLVTDIPNGNAYLYGTFNEGGSVTVKNGDTEFAKHTFNVTTEASKSYALDASQETEGNQ